MKTNPAERPLSPPSRNPDEAHDRSVAIVKPYMLRFRSDGALIDDEFAPVDDHLESEPRRQGSGRVLGIMTEPFN